jgi:hypothetical protein
VGPHPLATVGMKYLLLGASKVSDDCESFTAVLRRLDPSCQNFELMPLTCIGANSIHECPVDPHGRRTFWKSGNQD